MREDGQLAVGKLSDHDGKKIFVSEPHRSHNNLRLLLFTTLLCLIAYNKRLKRCCRVTLSFKFEGSTQKVNTRTSDTVDQLIKSVCRVCCLK